MKRRQPTRIGQFDKSFVLRTVRDFCLSIVAILVVVVGFSYWLTLQRFQEEGREQTRFAAERLADDVRSIMLNRGGPVALTDILQRLGPVAERLRATVEAEQRLLKRLR